MRLPGDESRPLRAHFTSLSFSSTAFTLAAGILSAEQPPDTLPFRFGDIDVSVRVADIYNIGIDGEVEGDFVRFDRLLPTGPATYAEAVLEHGSPVLRNERRGDPHLIVEDALTAGRAEARASEAPGWKAYKITDRVGVRTAYIGPHLLGAPVAVICSQSHLGRFCDLGAEIRPGMTFTYFFHDEVWLPQDWHEMVSFLETTLLTATDLTDPDSP